MLRTARTFFTETLILAMLGGLFMAVLLAPAAALPDGAAKSTAMPLEKPPVAPYAAFVPRRGEVSRNVAADVLAITKPVPEPVVRSAPAPRPAPGPPTSVDWDTLAQCESGGNWHINTGNGYYGGLQWSLRTWAAVKPAGAPDNPAEASREQEIAAADTLMSLPWGGLQHWPGCTRALGWR